MLVAVDICFLKPCEEALLGPGEKKKKEMEGLRLKLDRLG